MDDKKPYEIQLTDFVLMGKTLDYWIDLKATAESNGYDRLLEKLHGHDILARQYEVTLLTLEKMQDSSFERMINKPREVVIREALIEGQRIRGKHGL